MHNLLPGSRWGEGQRPSEAFWQDVKNKDCHIAVFLRLCFWRKEWCAVICSNDVLVFSLAARRVCSIPRSDGKQWCPKVSHLECSTVCMGLWCVSGVPVVLQAEVDHPATLWFSLHARSLPTLRRRLCWGRPHRFGTSMLCPWVHTVEVVKFQFRSLLAFWKLLVLLW